MADPPSSLGGCHWNVKLRRVVLITTGGFGGDGMVASVLVERVGSDHAPIPATFPPRVRRIYKNPG